VAAHNACSIDSQLTIYLSGVVPPQIQGTYAVASILFGDVTFKVTFHVLDQKIVTASLIITHVLWLGSTLILKSICDQKIFMVAAHEDFHASCTHRREQFSHGCCIPTQIGSGALLLITFLPAQHMLLC
jgi:hypothetical protein